MHKGYALLLCFLILSPAIGETKPVRKPRKLRQNDPQLYSREHLLALKNAIDGTGDSTFTTAQINEYMDRLLVELNNFIVMNGMDPYKLRDVDEGFDFNFIFIHITSRLLLTQGWLQGLSSFVRTGDVIVDYDGTNIKVTADLGMETLLFDYQYRTEIIGIGYEGGIDGRASNIKFSVVVNINFENLFITLEDFKILHSGDIDVTFTGNPLLDWAVNAFTNFTINIFRNLILEIFEDVIKGGMEDLIGAINDAIGGILNPTNAPKYIR